MLFKNREQLVRNGKTKELKQIRNDVLDILTSAINAVDAYTVVKTCFDGKNIILGGKKFNISDYDNIYLIGFGKASIRMADSVCDSIPIKNGAVITNEKHKTVKNNCISTFFGSHPIPNQKNIFAADKLLDIVNKCKKNDLLIVLISGGGSALFCKPRVNLNDFKKTISLLLKSGANIREINTIRKHLSFVKGGQLAKFAKCTVISLIISDIVSNPIEFIASGPIYPDSTTYNQTQSILKKYKLWMKIPISIRKTINNGIHGDIPETPKKNDPVFNKVFNFIVANNETACNAAEEKAEELGYKTMLLTTNLDGEAKGIGRFLVEKAINYKTYVKKMIFISGGETTVNVRGRE